jgi:hypothetical protein
MTSSSSSIGSSTIARASWRSDATTTSLAACCAAAGLLAVAALVFLGSGGEALTSAVHGARTYTAALDSDLQRVDDQIDGLQDAVAAEVADAVDSARAATQAAQSALEAATAAESDEARAAVELSDAQVALEAAAAQVRHVQGRVADDGAASSLTELLTHLDALRLGPDDA